MGDPVPELFWGFALRVIASVLAVVVALGVVATTFGGRGRPRLTASPYAFCAIGVFATVVVAALFTLAAPLPLLLTFMVLPPLAAGDGKPVRAAWRTLVAKPLLSVGGVILFGLLTVLAVTAATLLGLFVAGPLSAILTWLVAGTLVVLDLGGWASTYARAARTGKSVSGVATSNA